MAKKETWPKHQSGLHCGYTLFEDGRIRPAPQYAQQFEKLTQERQGINDLMKLFTSHCADLLGEIQRRSDRLWSDICEDYGLNKYTHAISYDGDCIKATPRPKDKETPDSADGDEGADGR